MLKLSIIIPVYNEEKTITLIIERVLNVSLINGTTREIIVVNDCSKDRTGEMVNKFIGKNPGAEIIYCEHEKNQGKGAAIHTGLQKASGQYVVVQDADLEVDPQEFNLLLEPVFSHQADVVFGSRFTGCMPRRVVSYTHLKVNKFLTALTNLFTNLGITDMETCYKLMRADVIKKISLKEKRFGFEPEVTIKLARVPAIVFYEVGISYHARTRADGKKIKFRDGMRAVVCILKYGLFRL